MSLFNECGDWPEDFEHENGCYGHVCTRCGDTFTAHKRRPEVCKECATTRRWIVKLRRLRRRFRIWIKSRVWLFKIKRWVSRNPLSVFAWSMVVVCFILTWWAVGQFYFIGHTFKFPFSD